MLLLLVESGDTQTNPGPKKPSFIKLFRWNLDRVTAHNLVKMPLIEAFITAQNFDICVCRKHSLIQALTLVMLE